VLAIALVREAKRRLKPLLARRATAPGTEPRA
jgi:hypothetical protein